MAFSTLSNRDAFGYPVRCRSAQDAGLVFSLITEGLIARWQMNGSAVDDLGTHNATVQAGAITYTTDKPIKGRDAAIFNGTPSYLSAPSTGIPTGDNPISGCCWANPAPESGLMFMIGGNSPWGCIGFDIEPTMIYVERGSGSFNVPMTIDTGVWHHLGFSYSPGLFKIYFNSVLVGTFSVTFNLISRSVVGLGGYTPWNDGWCMHGKMADMRLYSRELSASEFKSIYDGKA